MTVYKFKFIKPKLDYKPNGYELIIGYYPFYLHVIENQQIKEYPLKFFKKVITTVLGDSYNNRQTDYKNLEKILFKYIQVELLAQNESRDVIINKIIQSENNIIQLEVLGIPGDKDGECPFKPNDLDEVEDFIIEITIQTEKEKFANLIIEDKINEAIDGMLMANPNSNEIILMKSRFNKLKNDLKLGIITREEGNAEHNRIKQTLLEF